MDQEEPEELFPDEDNEFTNFQALLSVPLSFIALKVKVFGYLHQPAREAKLLLSVSRLGSELDCIIKYFETELQADGGNARS